MLLAAHIIDTYFNNMLVNCYLSFSTALVFHSSYFIIFCCAVHLVETAVCLSCYVHVHLSVPLMYCDHRLYVVGNVIVKMKSKTVKEICKLQASDNI